MQSRILIDDIVPPSGEGNLEWIVPIEIILDGLCIKTMRITLDEVTMRANIKEALGFCPDHSHGPEYQLVVIKQNRERIEPVLREKFALQF
jgi:hypothetical protein